MDSSKKIKATTNTPVINWSRPHFQSLPLDVQSGLTLGPMLARKKFAEGLAKKEILAPTMAPKFSIPPSDPSFSIHTEQFNKKRSFEDEDA